MHSTQLTRRVVAGYHDPLGLKMANRTPEQDLVDNFVAALRKHQDPTYCPAGVINQNCKSKTYADIEFNSTSGIHWVIEAKSHDSQDKHNTVHKIFGELLKETGRHNRTKSKYAVLIPEDGVQFYSGAFQAIDRNKFIAFGEIIPVETVFTFGQNGIKSLSWSALYDSKK